MLIRSPRKHLTKVTQGNPKTGLERISRKTFAPPSAKRPKLINSRSRFETAWQNSRAVLSPADAVGASGLKSTKRIKPLMIKASFSALSAR